MNILSTRHRPSRRTARAPATPAHRSRWPSLGMGLLLLATLLGSGAAPAATTQEVFSWGYNEYGQFGNGGNADSTRPVSLLSPLTGKTVTQVTAGADGMHSCALTTDGAVLCWGDNAYGQLGNGTTYEGANPALAVIASGALSGKTVTRVAAGDYHTCALTADGALYCWGYNEYGGLGDGTNTDSNQPVAVNTGGALSGKTVTAVAGGADHSCALTTDHAVYCWGGNGRGQLGDGTNDDSNLPVAVKTDGALSGKTVTRVSAGFTSTCVLTSDGAVYCWGDNFRGQLGNGTNDDSNVPVAVTTDGALSGKTVTALAVGSGHTCALTTDHAVYCWGSNYNGELGNGTNDASNVPVAVNIGGALSGETVTALAAGSIHTCALTAGGAVYCWGGNAYGALGDGTNENSNVPVAVKRDGVLNGKTVTAVTAGSDYSCALTTDGAVRCWGDNYSGQLGDGTTEDSNQAVAVLTGGPLSGKTITQVAAGNYHTCALTGDSAVWCWGYNGDGGLGDGTNTDSNQPVAVKTDGALSGKTVKALSAGDVHTCALTTDGAVYCWGYNYDGELGDGTNTASNEPVAVKTDGALSGKTVAALAGGSYHTCVLTTAGTVYCWGFNRYSQLGNGTNTDSNEPVAVTTDGALSGKIVTQVEAGDSHTCALTAGAGAYCWGYNSDGELGDGTNDNSSVPVAVTTDGALSGQTLTQIAAGEYHSCAVTDDGAVYCWGDNTEGTLGDGTNDSSTVPVAVVTGGVLSGETIKEVATGSYYSCARGAAGAVYCWGYNADGQLGNGTYDSVNMPVAVFAGGVLSGKPVTRLSIGSAGSHTVVLAGTPSATTPVSVGTTPAGLAFSVDGIAYSSTQTFEWEPGSSHTLATVSPQAGGAGTRYLFGSWSDTGAISHTVTAPAEPTTYNAGFAAQYQLTTALSPAGCGYVLPPSGGWYAAGSVVNVSVTPNTGYQLGNWTGPVANPASPATTVTLSAPQTVTANLVAGPALRAQVTGKGGDAANRVWTITLTNVGTGTAGNVQIASLGLTAWSGTACTPVLKTALPVAVADVAPGSPRTGTVTIDFSGCAAATKFKVDIGFGFGSGTTGTTSYTNVLR